MKNKPKNILCVHRNIATYQYYGEITKESAWICSIMGSFLLFMFNLATMSILQELFNVGPLTVMLKMSCDFTNGISLNDLTYLHKNYTETQRELNLLIDQKSRISLSTVEHSIESVINLYQQEILPKSKENFTEAYAFWELCFEENKKKFFKVFSTVVWYYYKILFIELVLLKIFISYLSQYRFKFNNAVIFSTIFCSFVCFLLTFFDGHIEEHVKKLKFSSFLYTFFY